MEIENFYLEAISILYNLNAQYKGNDVLEIIENGIVRPVTQDEFDAILIKATELKVNYDDNEYLRLRAAEMPTPSEQLSMMFEDEVNNTKTWRDFIKAIQDKYPKTEK